MCYSAFVLPPFTLINFPTPPLLKLHPSSSHTVQGNLVEHLRTRCINPSCFHRLKRVIAAQVALDNKALVTALSAQPAFILAHLCLLPLLTYLIAPPVSLYQLASQTSPRCSYLGVESKMASTMATGPSSLAHQLPAPTGYARTSVAPTTSTLPTRPRPASTIATKAPAASSAGAPATTNTAAATSSKSKKPALQPPPKVIIDSEGRAFKRGDLLGQVS